MYLVWLHLYHPWVFTELTTHWELILFEPVKLCANFTIVSARDTPRDGTPMFRTYAANCATFISFVKFFLKHEYMTFFESLRPSHTCDGSLQIRKTEIYQILVNEFCDIDFQRFHKDFKLRTSFSVLSVHVLRESALVLSNASTTESSVFHPCQTWPWAFQYFYLCFGRCRGTETLVILNLHQTFHFHTIV